MNFDLQIMQTTVTIQPMLVLDNSIFGNTQPIIIVGAVNDILLNADAAKNTVFVLLDICPSFDTAGHCILIDRLSQWVGISATAKLSCISSGLRRKC